MPGRARANAADLLVDAVSQIYEAAAGLADWTDALSAVAGITRSQYATLQGLSRDPTEAPLLFIYDSGIPPGVLDMYARFVPEFGCPRIDYGVSHRGVLFTDLAFIDERAMNRHPYYQEVFQPFDLFHGAMMEIAPPDAGWMAGITLQRSQAAGPFEPDTLRLFGIIAEHARKALRMARELLRGGVGAALADSLLTADTCGFILLGGRGQIIEMNAVANRMILQSPMLQVDGRELRMRPSRLHRVLEQEIQVSRLSTSSCARVPGLVPAGEISIQVYPLNAGRYPIGLPVRTMLLLTQRPSTLASDGLAGNSQERENSTRTLCNLYGLTASEGAIVLALCRGCSVADIAEQRRTSRDGVRFHLKNVFQKLHVKRQSELVRRIATGPAAFLVRAIN